MSFIGIEVIYFKTDKFSATIQFPQNQGCSGYTEREATHVIYRYRLSDLDANTSQCNRYAFRVSIFHLPQHFLWSKVRHFP